MGADTKIQWAHHTFNPWRGCTKVSPGCDHCYAETLSKRNPKVLGVWGDDGTRVVASESYWRAPHRWNLEAAKARTRHRVFCASLADVFEDRPDLDEPRARLFDLIARTQHLDWMLLTKRPENILRLVSRVEVDSIGYPSGTAFARRWWSGEPPYNVWIGTSTENQEVAELRIPELQRVPANVRFLSIEPMLDQIDLRLASGPRVARFKAGSGLVDRCACQDGPDAYPGTPHHHYAEAPHRCARCSRCEAYWPASLGVDLVIVGGESGPAESRPMHIDWVRALRDQCRGYGVALFVKQLGRNPILESPWEKAPVFLMGVEDPKGGVMEEWPEDLRVRELPARRIGERT